MKYLHLILVLVLTFSLSACGDAAMPDRESSEMKAQYTCPMHPHYIATDPNGSCPICGMDLVPVNNPSKEAQGEAVTVSETMIQTMGVRTSPVEAIEFGRTLRAFGTVEADERLENVSVSRLEGWIDDLSVRAEGDAVRNGDLLYRVYSPDLIAAQRDYVSALTAGNSKRIESVKQRLLSIGMQEQPLRQLTERKTVIGNVPVYAETDGIVAELGVRNGDYVKPGTPVLRLQSYNRVWIIASIPETDLPLIDRGISATLRFPSAPNAPSNGTVDYIYPTIDPKTRTARVRLELDNTNGDLQPGAYADITLGFAKQARLSIVSEAILRDSRGNHVILALGSGRFSTRSVTTGITAEGRTEILAGLSVGDSVVASGQFMLDSEVNLQEGLSKLSAPVIKPVKAMNTLGHQIDGSRTPLSALGLDAASLAQIDHFIDMALYFHAILVSRESLDPDFIEPAIELAELLSERYKESELVTVLSQSKDALIAAQSSFENEALAVQLAGLMLAIKPWMLEGKPQHYSELGLMLYRESSTGRLWLQRDEVMQNPYGDSESEVLAWPQLKSPSRKNSAEQVEIMNPHAGHH